MRILIDTNVLVRLAHLGDPDQPVADKALNSLRTQQHALRLVPQVIYEFWSVASRPVDRNGLDLPVGSINTLVNEWKVLFPVLRDERAILEIWQHLALQYRVRGKQAHDARLVAAMQRHGLTHILTFNPADFQRYADITILDPQNVAAS
ncbi:MAG TPA: type II toxin-antitoxin system VapC family toxin [Pirellulales bacterium]|jgi:predicted nucleic acid-binding protein|nr:type II toxin-antitoxin system VapC family toxin [Pirellulales bacterium]